MAENEQAQNNMENQNQENINNNEQQQDLENAKTFTAEELKALLEKVRKEGETSGYVKGKTDTNERWEKKNAEAVRLAKEEAEKQSKFEKMSELEKAQAKAKENEEELRRLKDQMALNEQKEETRKLMRAKGLPENFLNAVLVFKDAEATQTNIDEMKQLFDSEVQKAVEARIPTHVPKQNQNTQTGNTNMGKMIDEEDARRVLGLK